MYTKFFLTVSSCTSVLLPCYDIIAQLLSENLLNMLPTLMINLVSLTRTEAALENIMDTLVFPLSDK